MNDDDVIQISDRYKLSVGSTFTVTELKNWLKSVLPNMDSVLVNGVEGRTLSASESGWKSGKIKIVIEFVESESPPDQSE